MSGPVRSLTELTADERRWLHDKYAQLAAEEGQLAGARTSYFATIAAVQFTGFVVLVTSLLSRPVLFAGVTTLLGGFGVLIAVVWALLLHRTYDAQELWRRSARLIESQAPPLEASAPVTMALGSGQELTIDLTRPFLAHAVRFSPERTIPWIDRFNPYRLSEIMPVSLVALWTGTIVGSWVWALLYA